MNINWNIIETSTWTYQVDITIPNFGYWYWQNNFDYNKFSYQWNLSDEPYKEIISFKDWKFYLSYDWVAYFIIMTILSIFLFRSFVKFCQFAYNLWYNFFVKWKKF